MKGQYRIDVDRNLIFKSHAGQISVDDEIELLEAMMSDPQYRRGMNAVCDFSEATVEWTLADVDRFRQHMTRVTEKAGECKWAIVHKQGADTSTGRVFIALHSAFEKGITFKLFSDVQSAEEWAAGSAESDSER